jgi:hypothetical protein
LPNKFVLVKNALWLSIGWAVFCIIAGIQVSFWLAFLTFVSVIQGYWLISHKESLRSQFVANETDYETRIRNQNPIGFAKLSPIGSVLLLFFAGYVGIWLALDFAQGAQPTRIFRLLHNAIGTTGLIMLSTALGASAIARAIEVLIGYRTNIQK